MRNLGRSCSSTSVKPLGFASFHSFSRSIARLASGCVRVIVQNSVCRLGDRGGETRRSQVLWSRLRLAPTRNKVHPQHTLVSRLLGAGMGCATAIAIKSRRCFLVELAILVLFFFFRSSAPGSKDPVVIAQFEARMSLLVIAGCEDRDGMAKWRLLLNFRWVATVFSVIKDLCCDTTSALLTRG